MDVNNIKVTRMLDLAVPNPVMGKVIARQDKNRFIDRDKIFVKLQMDGNPVVALSTTLPMNVQNLSVGREYRFKRYNLFYNPEYEGNHSSSFCFDRGESFSEVGHLGKVRYYKAVE